MVAEQIPPLTECSEKKRSDEYLCQIIGQMLEQHLPASFCTTVHLENAQHELFSSFPQRQ